MNNEDMIAAQLTAATVAATQTLALVLGMVEGFGQSPAALLDQMAVDGAAGIGQSEADGESPERQAELIEQAKAAFAELIGGLRAQYKSVG